MRDMNYDSEEKIWNDFKEYKDWVKNNPIEIEDYVGKDPMRVMRQKPRPLTLSGFENFVFSKRGFSIHDYFYSPHERYKKFSTICLRVKQEIRQNQIEGGMAGIYNPSITQRLNGLSDKKEIHTDQDNEVVVRVLKGKKKESNS